MTDVVMTLPRHSSAGGTRPRPAGDLRRRTREPLVLFVAATAVYLLAGWSLIHVNIVFEDALSRVANAFYVLFSRDPHLPAMGFVWNPLPQFAILPILPLKSLFPGLVVRGGAGAIQSALSMAGTVVVLSSCLHKLGVGRRPRLCSRRHLRFAADDRAVRRGRNERPDAAAVSDADSLSTHLMDAAPPTRQSGSSRHRPRARIPGPLRSRRVGARGHRARCRDDSGKGSRGLGRPPTRLALNDAALVAAPPAFAFFFWAASAKILVDEWLPTFSSQYGNSAQTSNAEQTIEQVTGDTLGETLAHLGRQTVGLAPLFTVLLPSSQRC